MCVCVRESKGAPGLSLPLSLCISLSLLPSLSLLLSPLSSLRSRAHRVSSSSSSVGSRLSSLSLVSALVRGVRGGWSKHGAAAEEAWREEARRDCDERVRVRTGQSEERAGRGLGRRQGRRWSPRWQWAGMRKGMSQPRGRAMRAEDGRYFPGFGPNL